MGLDPVAVCPLHMSWVCRNVPHGGPCHTGRSVVTRAKTGMVFVQALADMYIRCYGF